MFRAPVRPRLQREGYANLTGEARATRVAKMTLAAALLHAMLILAPPGKLAALPQYAGFEETAEERTSRYESFAADVAEVVKEGAPLPGRSKTATGALLLALAFEESGFAKDADVGPACYRGKDGKNARCDSGRSACALQVNLGKGKTPEGWTQADLFADRKKCLRVGLRLARRSFSACASMGATHLLDAYASGLCGLGVEKGSKRLATATRIERLLAAGES